VAVVSEANEHKGTLHKQELTAKVLHDGIADRHGYAHTKALPDSLSQKHRNLSLPLLHHASHSSCTEILGCVYKIRYETVCCLRRPILGDVLVCSRQLLKHSLMRSYKSDLCKQCFQQTDQQLCSIVCPQRQGPT
jgi:hypothetical protein